MTSVTLKIKKLRRAARLTQGALAAKVGMGITQLSLLENGRYRPQPITLLKLARALKADAAELMEPWDELD